jgi:hypothetical protein
MAIPLGYGLRTHLEFNPRNDARTQRLESTAANRPALCASAQPDWSICYRSAYLAFNMAEKRAAFIFRRFLALGFSKYRCRRTCCRVCSRSSFFLSRRRAFPTGSPFLSLISVTNKSFPLNQTLSLSWRRGCCPLLSHTADLGVRYRGSRPAQEGRSAGHPELPERPGRSAERLNAIARLLMRLILLSCWSRYGTASLAGFRGRGGKSEFHQGRRKAAFSAALTYAPNP